MVVFGDLYLKAKDYDTAWGYYSAARTSFCHEDAFQLWKRCIWTALIHMGDIQLEAGRFGDARNYFVISLLQCRQISVKLGAAQCVQRLGDLLWKMDPQSSQDAESCYLAVSQILQPLGATRHMADVTLRLGLVELGEGNKGIAFERLRQASNLYEEAEDEEGLMFALTFWRIIKIRHTKRQVI